MVVTAASSAADSYSSSESGAPRDLLDVCKDGGCVMLIPSAQLN